MMRSIRSVPEASYFVLASACALALTARTLACRPRGPAEAVDREIGGSRPGALFAPPAWLAALQGYGRGVIIAVDGRIDPSILHGADIVDKSTCDVRPTPNGQACDVHCAAPVPVLRRCAKAISITIGLPKC